MILDCGKPGATDFDALSGTGAANPVPDDVPTLARLRAFKAYGNGILQTHLSFDTGLAGSLGWRGLHYDPAGGAAGTTPSFLVLTGSGASWTLHEHAASDGSSLRTKALALPSGESAMFCRDVARSGSTIWVLATTATATYLLKLAQSNLAEATPVAVTLGEPPTTAKLGVDGTGVLLLAYELNNSLALGLYNGSTGAQITIFGYTQVAPLVGVLGVEGEGDADSGGKAWVAYELSSGEQFLRSFPSAGLAGGELYELPHADRVEVRAFSLNASAHWTDGLEPLDSQLKMSALARRLWPD